MGRRCRKCGMRRERDKREGDNMEKIKCPYCGKINHTTLPELVSKCGYCGREFRKEEQERLKANEEKGDNPKATLISSRR